MSVVAYSIGKAPRHDATKKASNVQSGPGSYEVTMINRKKTPQWTIPARQSASALLNLTHGPGPQSYDVPSKLIERPGITIAPRYKNDLSHSHANIPGPGEYSPEKRDKNIAFTMQGRYNTIDYSNESLPGPGEYDGNKQFKIKVAKFGKANREFLNKLKTLIPGPGEYRSEDASNFKKSAPKCVFPVAQRRNSDEREKLLVPGPGSYDQPNMIGRDGPSKTLAAKARDPVEKELLYRPGPGDYDPEYGKVLKNSPSAKIPRARREDLKQRKQLEFKPDPTLYNPSDSFTRGSPSAWGFGTSNRPKLDAKNFETPAPNQYSIPPKTGEGPKHVIGGRTKDPRFDKRDDIPGPAEYVLEDAAKFKIKNDPAFSIGQSKREDYSILKKKSSLPGPADYDTVNDPLRRSAPRCKFGTSTREDSLENTKSSGSLGPGAYEAKTYIGFEGRMNSLAPKVNDHFSDKETRNKPGPCDYNTTSNFFKKRNPAFKFGSAQKPDIVPKEKASLPDPCLYDVDDQAIRGDNKGYVFGTSKREDDIKFHRQRTPGPGDYFTPNQTFNDHKFYMGVKLKDQEQFLTPGPGQYDQPDIPTNKKGPSYTMSKRLMTSTYIKQSSMKNPGPGDYDTVSSSQALRKSPPKCSFGNSTRNGSRKRNEEVPGPGQYRVPVKVANLPRYALPNATEEFKFLESDFNFINQAKMNWLCSVVCCGPSADSSTGISQSEIASMKLMLPFKKEDAIKAQDEEEPLIFCFGQLSGFLHLQNLPVSIPISQRQVQMISIGELHCIMLLGNGQLYGVGSNERGQLGMPHDLEAEKIIQNMTKIDVPCVDLNREQILQISSGSHHNVLLLKNISSGAKRVVAFGSREGVSPVKLIKDSKVGVEIFDEKKVKELAKADFIYSRYDFNALVCENQLYVWGSDPNSWMRSEPELFYESPNKIKQLAFGMRHRLALLYPDSKTPKIGDQDLLYGWGDDTYGELGEEILSTLKNEPRILSYFKTKRVTHISAGARHSVIVDRSGHLHTMGDNSYDQCAVNARRSLHPQKVLIDFSLSKVYSGENHNVGIDSNHKVYYWGGSSVNKSWTGQGDARFSQFQDLSYRTVSLIEVAHSNTVVITGQYDQLDL